MTTFSTETADSRPDDDRGTMGAVYTPAALARWTASLLREVATTPITAVLDPACGDGALLKAARHELPGLESVKGFDRSRVAVDAAKAALRSDTVSIECRDTLTSARPDAGEGTAVIMNPPWGADLSGQASQLREWGYTLANGQFDSWDLFVEWSLRAVPANTLVAAILPDSLFLPEHVATRRLLLQRSQLNVVARLGEGWFDGVFRGVAVLTYTTGRPTTAPVRTIRIDHAARRRIVRGETTLAHEGALGAHTIDPGRWTDDTQAAFHASVPAFDSPWPDVMAAHGGPWVNWFVVGRGVEMGARGELFRCERCGWHRGPSRNASFCKNCQRPSEWSLVQAITSEEVPGAVPLIVGRDVRRYTVEPSRWLRTGLIGVSYKDPALYRCPKLLVRKTGLGLNASVDRSGSHTNQVVFHYVPRDDAPDWAMHYVEGVLCSKVMLALHLARSGETEWRSHPYVTPKVLATLPVPVPSGAEAISQAKAIAAEAAALHESPASDRVAREQRVDELVAGLYGLDADGCAWVEHALAQTQTLDAFAHVRSAPPLKAVVA